MKFLAFVPSLFLASASFAADLVCVHDMTPADGNRKTLTVAKNEDGLYNVTLEKYNPWSDETTTNVLATNLPCAQDGVFFTCARGRSGSETINSGLTTQEVSTKRLVPDQGIVTSVALEAVVYSDAAQNLGLAHQPITFPFGEGIMAAKCELK